MSRHDFDPPLSVARGFAWRGAFGVPLSEAEERLLRSLVRVWPARILCEASSADVDLLNRQLALLQLEVSRCGQALWRLVDLRAPIAPPQPRPQPGADLPAGDFMRFPAIEAALRRAG